MTRAPRITFGIIVLNGEPFTRYLLRSLYSHAHEIIVAEGAAPAAAGISRVDGHSRDGTLEVLREFARHEDTGGKLTIVTAEDEGYENGFWPGEKDEQSRAWAKRATGEYLWQVDIDEFYLDDDIDRVKSLLVEDPSITGMAFRQFTFWGGLAYRVDGWYHRRYDNQVRRVFKWGPGYEYVSHRPPTVVDQAGTSMYDGHWLESGDHALNGVHLFHYSLLFPKQVGEKSEYYSKSEWAKEARPRALEWAEQSYTRLSQPFRVHNVFDYPSWLDRYEGKHPDQVETMMSELADTGTDVRNMEDVDRLLASRRYQLGRWMLGALEAPDRWAHAAWRPVRNFIQRRR